MILSMGTTVNKAWKTPAAFLTFSLNVLLTHVAPKQVVISERAPQATYLCCTSEADRIQKAQHTQRPLAWEESEWINANGPGQLRRQQ